MTTSWWHPDRLARRRANLATRGRVLRAVRAFFEAQNFAEVETPALQVSPGLEPHLQAMAVTVRDPAGGSAQRYLHTSPEFAMKKLLTAGEPRIFQLAKVFRDAERSATHHPEFTMLEWYRAGADYRALMDDCEGFVRACAAAAGADALRWQGRASDPRAPFERLSVADAFARHAGIDLLATAPDPHAPDAALLAAAATRAGIPPHEGDDWESLFFRIFLERIEPSLGSPVPTLLYDYPISMAALSRPHPTDPRLAERFELYVCGLELANAFSELTDPVAQRARFEADMTKKQRLYGQRYPIDEDFLGALAAGYPESAGIALGIDRLVMLCCGADHIEDVLWAPVM
ncbi:MAG: EF-P lysine aminoacylase GenX [Alphaproteobacteria bacterium]|nr:EF-P lysine aminoacylase GenX [Alphaproteobacteria bacterium]